MTTSTPPPTPRLPISANIRWLAAAHLAVKPIWFLFLLYSTRLLGAREFGITMVAISFTSILMVMLEGGIDIHTVRELSKSPENYARLLAHSGTLKMAGGVVVAVVAAVLSFVPGVVPFARHLLVPALLYAIFNALMIHARAIFRAFEIMQFEAVSIVIEKTAVVVLCGLALVWRRDAGTFLDAYALAYGAACLLTVAILFRKLGRPRRFIEMRALWTDVLRPGLPFALMNLFAIIYFRSGTLILSYVTGRDELVGYFNAGYRLVESYMLFPTIVIGPIYPVLARRFREGAALSPLILNAVRAVLLVSIVITLPLVLFRGDFTRLLYGSGFAPAAPAVAVVCLAMIPVSLNFVFGSLVAAAGRQGRANWFIVGITALNVAANFLLIPRWGVVGAAAVTVGTETLLAAANTWLTRDFVRWRAAAALAARLAIPALLAIAAAFAGVERLGFPMGPVVVVALLGIGGLALRLVTLDDLRLLTGLRRKPRPVEAEVA